MYVVVSARYLRHSRINIDLSAFYLIYEIEFVLFLAVLENSVLTMGWDSSHATLKSDIRTINFRSDATFAPHENTEWRLEKIVL